MRDYGAIIPQEDRVSLHVSLPMEDGGIRLGYATAHTYVKFQEENGPWDFGVELPSDSMMAWVRGRGVAVSQEIFDTVRIGVPFTARQLVGELMTLQFLAEKTQYCIIQATLQWLSLQEETHVKRNGAAWVLSSE